MHNTPLTPQHARSKKHDWLMFLGLAIALLMVIFAVFAPMFSPYNPSTIDVNSILLPPSFTHLFGTDALGRDVFTRMAYGARISLLVGFVAVGIAALIGVALGALAGFYGKWVDSLLMRLVDIMLCFPSFFLILAVIALLEPSIMNIMVVIGLTSWMGFARFVRADIMRLKTLDYIAAATLSGVSDKRLIIKYLLPNAMAPVLVTVTLGIAAAVLVESGLSFLGIGVQPPTPSWGNILTEGKANIEIAWWLSLFPGMAILLTVLAFNLIGEGLRTWLDPQQ